MKCGCGVGQGWFLLSYLLFFDQFEAGIAVGISLMIGSWAACLLMENKHITFSSDSDYCSCSCRGEDLHVHAMGLCEVEMLQGACVMHNFSCNHKTDR